MSLENQFLELADSLVSVFYVRKEGVNEVKRRSAYEVESVTLHAGYSWQELPLGPKGAAWKPVRNSASAGELWLTTIDTEFLQVNPALLQLSDEIGKGRYVLKVTDAYGHTYLLGDQDFGGRFAEGVHDGGSYDNVVNESRFQFKIVTGFPPLRLRN